MKRLLVTGGTGFFGKSILDYRLRHPEFLRDVRIAILSRHPESFVRENPVLANQPGVSFVRGDVRDFPADAVGACDTVIHAATAAVTTISDDEMTSTIVEGTRHVLDIAKTLEVKRLLFTSSGAVYGPRFDRSDESCPLAPTTAYGRGKLAAERMCVDSGVPTCLARCFAFTGPHLNRRIHFAIGNFIQDCLDNRTIIIKGDGTPLRSYLYADDLVEWLFTILEHGKENRPYNVGSPDGISIRELAETVRSALGTDNAMEVTGMPDGHPPSVYVPDVTRAMTELGLSVKVSLRNAIRLSAV